MFRSSDSDVSGSCFYFKAQCLRKNDEQHKASDAFSDDLSDAAAYLSLVWSGPNGCLYS